MVYFQYILHVKSTDKSVKLNSTGSHDLLTSVEKRVKQQLQVKPQIWANLRHNAHSVWDADQNNVVFPVTRNCSVNCATATGTFCSSLLVHHWRVLLWDAPDYASCNAFPSQAHWIIRGTVVFLKRRLCAPYVAENMVSAIMKMFPFVSLALITQHSRKLFKD